MKTNNLLSTLTQDWHALLSESLTSDSFKALLLFLGEAYANTQVYPPRNLLFNALKLCALADVKVVILGQDPYHGAGEAMGLSFSVPPGQKLPPSLRNIYKALQFDLGIAPHWQGDLSNWASQGVLLLNTVLSVEENKAASHQNKGWELFTDALIQGLNAHKSNLVFMLWGKQAQAKKTLINTNKHLVLEAVHPSPLSAHRGFISCKHFSLANSYLHNTKQTPINWDLNEERI